MYKILNESTIPSLSNNENDLLPYMVGALLYSPATNTTLLSTILNHKINSPYSLALCLEDTITETAIDLAQHQIVKLFQSLSNSIENGSITYDEIPKIFIRVRYPKQILSLFQRLEPYQELLYGFILPKYSVDCCFEYANAILNINQRSKKRIYMMPILESSDIMDLHTRSYTLTTLKNHFTFLSDYILNIRVGGNDFCKKYGIRRHINESIYDIQAISQVLGDIITTFGQNYIISAPVWEYFSSPNNEWKVGLQRELQLDKLNGFVGKTVIHPNQVPVVNEALKVEKSDFIDAQNILTYQNDLVQVAKSHAGERMNEIATHTQWAKKILSIAAVYGIKD